MSEWNEARARAVLAETADAVVPGDRLSAILDRAGTDGLAARRRRRRGWFAVGGTAVATAAAVTAFAVLDQSPPQVGPGPVGPATTVPTEAEPTDVSPSASAPPVNTAAAPVYFAGETPFGLRLYREFRNIGLPAAADRFAELDGAIAAAVDGPAHDPEYRSLWPAEASVVSTQVIEPPGSADEVDRVEVHLDAPVERPADMTAEEARLAIEQVIYTVQGVVGARAPVWFKVDGNPVNEVLGVPTSEPLANGPVLDTLAHVNLTTPTEGQVVTGDLLQVTGVGNSYEANLLWRLQPERGADVVAEGFFTLQGAMEPRLFPFEGSVDVSTVPPGRYLLTVSTEDASGGAEGPGPYSDTRLVDIQ